MSSIHSDVLANTLLVKLIFLLSFKKWVLSENRNKVGFPRWLSGKDSTSQSEHAGSVGWIPGLGRTLGEGNGYPLQYSCLEDSMDQGAWQATVYGVTKSQIWLSNWADSTGKEYNATASLQVRVMVKHILEKLTKLEKGLWVWLSIST